MCLLRTVYRIFLPGIWYCLVRIFLFLNRLRLQLNRPSDAALSRQREKVINKPHPVENVPPKEIKVEKSNNLPDDGDPAKVLKEVDGVEDSTLKKSTAEK